MTATTHRFEARGHRVVTRTPRRYIVVHVRTQPYTTPKGTYVAFARVEKRTDSIKTAKVAQRRFGRVNGAFAVVIDSATGQEI